jgi:hypothetical protein
MAEKAKTINKRLRILYLLLGIGVLVVLTGIILLFLYQ